MNTYIYVGGAYWPLPAFVASRQAALGLATCGARAQAELAAVAAVLAVLTERVEVAA